MKRAEIDTSAPFDSVKEAVSRFGGRGYWKPSSQLTLSQHEMEETVIAKVEEQAALLEKDLILKERETLEVLKELESTKANVEQLKLKLQKQASEVKGTLESNAYDGDAVAMKEENKDCTENPEGDQSSFSCPSSAPGLILMELKQAKFNLLKTTTDLADIRGSVEVLNKKLEKERMSLEKTRERLTMNSTKISSLEGELNQEMLKLAKDSEMKDGSSDSPLDISKQLQRLSSVAEQFKEMGEAAKSEVQRAVSEIELTRSRIKTAEIRLMAARKMKQAARAAEAVALADIKALSKPSGDSSIQLEGVTLTFEEYTALTSKAREAEELAISRVTDAMVHVDDANISKMEILKQVEEATEEIKTSQKALEEALNRVEAATKEKLAVEEALRNRRSENRQKRRSSVQNNNKFKNSYPSQHRKDIHLVHANGMNIVSDESIPVPKPTLSIGQILTRKLLMPHELEGKMMTNGKGLVKREVSLGQMLRKSNAKLPSNRTSEKENSQKQFSEERKKFGFAKFVALTKQSKRKEKPTLNLR